MLDIGFVCNFQKNNVDSSGERDLIVVHPLLGEGSQYPGLYGQSGYRRAAEWEISGIIACCCWRLVMMRGEAGAPSPSSILERFSAGTVSGVW